MTELQMGLIGFGGVVVVGVFAFNKWQEYRHRKLVEQVLRKSHPDVLFDGEAGAIPKEPAVADCAEPAQEAPASGEQAGAEMSYPESRIEPFVDAPVGSERIEPVLQIEPVQETVATQVPEPVVNPAVSSAEEILPERQPASLPDVTGTTDQLLCEQVDYIATLEAADPVPVAQVLEIQRQVRARVSKPVNWVGYNEAASEWEPVVAGGTGAYRQLRAGLQLVDRQGAVSEADLARFQSTMQDLAVSLMAMVDLPSRQPAQAAAAKLDEFCAGVDIQIGINVISQGQPFSGTKLRALAEAAGMVIDAQGRFVRCDDEGNVLYVLMNQDPAGFKPETIRLLLTPAVTFLLDVPRVAHGERVFNQMVEQARRFAEVLRGTLVDDNRRPLSEGSLEPIRRQIAQYQSLMAAQNLPAGSPVALRLFS
ncbi:cell division protein ZipA C-terminal FtsZ-binding domain-containing protein [Propionivibrio limicola]|uniref:cell division protein ZipA C-terminal FtsZ-binding domain-containing protein n=1 Tax=Propionivibrio limicola TaxID=167645 RepID=UPI0012923160|nr:cell division protein ZipA C-terminal FtsZ-binding domain-containing protein [Propionivibrio limicola]